MSYRLSSAGRLTRISVPAGNASSSAMPASGSPLWGMAVVVYKLAPPAGGGSDHFTLGYDGLERLTTIAGPVAETFTLDGGSNITARTGPAKTFSIDGSNRPTSDGTSTLTWNTADRLTGRGADTFGFDPLDRLTSSTVAGTSRTYAYNGDGLLQSRTQGGSTTMLLWDPATSPSRLLVSGSDRIVYGLGPLYSVNGTTVTTFARDGQKSIRAQLSGTSVTASWRYRAYGEIAQSSGAATPSLLGYAGQLLDPSGLYYLRARWYDAGSGRLLTRDAFGASGSFPASLNAFAYAFANPVTLSDPSGNCPVLWLCPQVLIQPTWSPGIRTYTNRTAYRDDYGVFYDKAKLNSENDDQGAGDGAETEGAKEGEGSDDPGTGAEKPALPEDPAQPPGPGYVWKGGAGSAPGDERGSWVNEETGERLHPHLRGGKHSPHWDYIDGEDVDWRGYPDGRWERKW